MKVPPAIAGSGARSAGDLSVRFNWPGCRSNAAAFLNTYDCFFIETKTSGSSCFHTYKCRGKKNGNHNRIY